MHRILKKYSFESKFFNYKMDEHSSESFTRIYISSWMSIHESKVFNLKMDEHSSELNYFNYKMDEH
jgi:hypothetical protein